MKQCRVGNEGSLPHALGLERDILHTGFFSFPVQSWDLSCSSDNAVGTDLHFGCEGSLRQAVGMKVAFRIVTIFRLYPPSAITPFPKS